MLFYTKADTTSAFNNPMAFSPFFNQSKSLKLRKQTSNTDAIAKLPPTIPTKQLTYQLAENKIKFFSYSTVRKKLFESFMSTTNLSDYLLSHKMITGIV